MKREAGLVGLLAVAATILTGCGSSPTPYRYFTVTAMKSPVGQREILLKPKVPVRGLVLYEHGYGQTEETLLRTADIGPLRDALLSNGFAMAASFSHGDNMGRPDSVEDQALLLRDAEQRLPAVPAVDIVAFSMGGLDALMAASRHIIPNLDALVLMSPVCNQVPFLQSPLGPGLRTAFGGETGQPLLDAITPSDPERQDPRSFAGYRYWFWQSPDDTTVPPVQAASMMAILTSAGVDARLSPLDGNHGNFTKLQPQAIVKYFEARG